jgi:putative protease
VASSHDGVVAIELEQDIQAGDVIEFWTNKGHFAHTVQGMERGSGKTVRIVVEKRVGKGDRVFRLRSAAAAFVDDADNPKVPLKGSVELTLGKPIRLTLCAPDGTSATCYGPQVEPARTKAVTSAEVREHIDRFGGTPFSLDSLDVLLDEGVGIGFSQLHKLRAQTVESLIGLMLAAYRSRNLPRIEQRRSTPAAHPSGCIVAAWATNATCARAAKKAGADAVYVPALNFKRGESVVAGQLSETVAQTSYPNKAIIALPTIDHDPLPGTREARLGFDAWEYVKPNKPVFADNLGQVLRCAQEGCAVEVGPHVPALNPLAVNVLGDWGASRVWLSPELSLGQIQDIADRTDVALGLTIMGANELMVTEHCVLMSQGPCDRNCAACARRRSPHFLKDRKDYETPVITDCCGRSHLYNAVPLDIAHMAPDLIRAGISAFMVDTTLLNSAQTTEAVARAARARDIALRTGDTVSKSAGTTTGHIFRGIA